MNGRIKSFDGLRGVAILLVILGHGLGAYAAGWHGIVPAILGNSSLGVRLFFVLSGYLITSLLVSENERNGCISLRRFYARRSLRIFPAFYLFLAAVWLLASFGYVEVARQQYLAAATYTWNYVAVWYPRGPVEGSWFLGHLWTLSLEEQFYLFWPILIVSFGWRAARWTCTLLPLVLPVVRVVSYYAFPEHRGYLGMMFHTAIDSILVGCAFALWRDKLPDILSSNRSVLCICCCFVFLVSPTLAESIRPYRVTIGFGLDAFAVGILTIHARRDFSFSSVLSWAPLTFIGRLSYSLYLWQQLFLTDHNSHWTGTPPWSFVCTFLAAIGSHFLVERPFLELKTRFTTVESSEHPSTRFSCAGS